jgi:hypothetical protein
LSGTVVKQLYVLAIATQWKNIELFIEPRRREVREGRKEKRREEKRREEKKNEMSS